MNAFAARLQRSEPAWCGALFCGLWLVLASGSPAGSKPLDLVAQPQAAALGALLSLWVARASGLRRHGLAIALAALFTTPLLPYAFAGQALTLPLLLFAAAFLAIGPSRLRPPVRDVAQLGAAAGVLVCAATGLLLLPLLLWLAWFSAERSGTERRADPKPRFYAATALLLLVFAARISTLDWTAIDFADSPVEWLIHLHGFLLSLNKGLLIFAPLVLVGLWRAFRGAVADRRNGQFALFSAASLLLPFAALERWTDASWGPQPLLAAVAPALLALALSRTERARRGGHRRWIIAAVAFGLAVNTLGTAIPQSALADLAGVSRAGTSVVLPFDPAWNHPRVNAALLGAWVWRILPPSLKPPPADSPSVAAPAPGVRPSPVLLRVFDPAERRALMPAALLLAFSGALGWMLLVLVRHAART